MLFPLPIPFVYEFPGTMFFLMFMLVVCPFRFYDEPTFQTSLVTKDDTQSWWIRRHCETIFKLL